MPREYPKSPCYQLKVEEAHGGFSVEMHLEIATGNSEVANFESVYLLGDVFSGAPSPVASYTPVYYNNGKPLCTVTRDENGTLTKEENGKTSLIQL